MSEVTKKETNKAPRDRKRRPSADKKPTATKEVAPSAEDAGAAAPKAQQRGAKVPPQPAQFVRGIVSQNELLQGICGLEHHRTTLEASVSLAAAEAALGADPVALEAAFRLLEGLGLGKFVTGRRGTETRFVWFVGNACDIVKGAAEEYTRPAKLSTGVGRGLRAVLKVSLSVEQRAALAKSLGKENITQADLKEWAETILFAACEMLTE